MKYHLITLGCQMNKSDSERVKTVIEGIGFRWTENEEEANLLGVLACSVRQKSINKVYSQIAKWNKRKDRESLITFVSGCVLPADREKFLKLFDLIFTMNELPQFPEMIQQYGIVTPASVRKSSLGQESHVPTINKKNNEGPIFDLSAIVRQKTKISAADIQLNLPENPDIKEFWDIIPEYDSSFEAFVPIQNGCDKFCTFCAVPYTRGREVSRPSEEILSEVKRLVENGYKTITLLGQNVNSYGFDKKGNEISFSELLKKIGEYGDTCGKEFWTYFTSPHPRDMGVDVIEVIAKHKCLAKQIHIPIQSGDDKVLMRMNRKHNVDTYRHIIESIREKLPEATIFTDIIVGFTGETEEQFQNTIKAMNEFRYNMAYIAIYSPRPGATSSRWEDDIPQPEKKERLHRLTAELEVHARNYNNTLVDKTLKVLIAGTEKRSGYLSAYTEGKIPVRIYSYDKSRIGEFATVKIISAGDFSVAADFVEVMQESEV
ncbi:MAG: MiaB/RimO family radical SAM methylthiotransferase [Bacteroidales bacterium]|nr:MiaB/RimO family radical SAM methylthiotransferase [Bacteroidales bacterium]MCF8458765.1 MiaB/RimO family radical SAM methylthiotransferase [Bacteroidales bacterium]